MASREIRVDLTADTSKFEGGMRSASGSVDKFEGELKSADAAASRFDDGLGKVNDGLGSSTDKFRSTADLAGGLGNVLGIEVLGQAEAFATGMADIADGMGGLLAPALTKAKAAFVGLNTTMLANPIFLVVALIAALTAAFVVAYKKSETFRNIVNKVFNSVKDGAIAFKDAVVGAVVGAARRLGRIAEIITTPYRLAFNAIAKLWNGTVGKLSFSIPGWVPGIGGSGFDVPDIPELAHGGPARAGMPHIVGENGPEVFVPRMSGTVIPNGGGMGGTVTVQIQTGASDLDELIRKRVRVIANGNVQKAFGAA